MAYYQQQYPPYGAQPPPQGNYYGQMPPPGGQQYPPSGQYPYPQQPAYPQQQPYGSPAPPPHGQYGQPPPLHQPYGGGPPPVELYGSQPAYGAPPPAHQVPYGQPPPHQHGYGHPPAPPQPGYGAPPPGPPPAPYGAPAYGGNFPPTPPSLGYAPQSINWDPSPDVNALRAAMKGWGTDEAALIRILSDRDPLQVDAIRNGFRRNLNRDLIKDIESETSSWRSGGPGTKELVLNDVLLGRSNADMRAIKQTFQSVYHRPLEEMVSSDLSFKTKRQFEIVMQAVRAEDSAPVVPTDTQRDVRDLYAATEGKIGTDEIMVCSIFALRNDNQIRAIAVEYQRQYSKSLEDVIRNEFSGHMEDALLYQLRHALDRYMHQAKLLEDAMAGLGTKDHLLVSRVVRSHWDRNNMANVRIAFEKRYGNALARRIDGETSGDYKRLMLACVAR
ncbi:annexin A7 [Magnaporthiopsis poae ATCC 64411]|uniref:Annexin A7 n=1 Tax=Magnaporthiopsis poae (strain ATCC 64411 / 73-15) TaxID=644358 RepID=A0A0C4DW56_MAGP6|nr:annexin A7 [Magnaporthiopsis poae ATCC 64411]